MLLSYIIILYSSTTGSKVSPQPESARSECMYSSSSSSPSTHTHIPMINEFRSDPFGKQTRCRALRRGQVLHPTYFDCVSTVGRHLEALVYRGAAEVVHHDEAVRDERLLHVDCAAYSATEVRWGGGRSGYAGKHAGSAPLERVGCLSRPRISRGYRSA